jgi:hypothetical protein
MHGYQAHWILSVDMDPKKVSEIISKRGDRISEEIVAQFDDFCVFT